MLLAGTLPFYRSIQLFDRKNSYNKEIISVRWQTYPQ